jgi:ubiquinone/menaquinone biosynthesis C-methylase UbiE
MSIGNFGNTHIEPRAPGRYEYWYDGLIRRKLHEYGLEERDFVNEVLAKMGYLPGDVALEVGAGVGQDARHIAWEFRPRLLFLLEPSTEDPAEFDGKYYQIEYDLHGREYQGVKVLSSVQLDQSIAVVSGGSMADIPPGTTYIQPMPGVAEDIPMPDNSVNKLSMIYSIYEFSDVRRALSEAVRVMTPGATGVIVTNGPKDKLMFKDILRNAAIELNKEDPGRDYKAASTVSARINYFQAAELVSDYFEEVSLYAYEDAMKITEERIPLYLHSYNTYRRGFQPAVEDSVLWREVRDRVLKDRIEYAISKNGGVFWDTIDTGAVFFRKPKK